MSLIRAVHEAIRDLRAMVFDFPPPKSDVEDVYAALKIALSDPGGVVDLAVCIGAECIADNGMRLATWQGVGSCSIYTVCDECYLDRLTAEEREHMRELFGAAWVRHLGLHTMQGGRLAKEAT